MDLPRRDFLALAGALGPARADIPCLQNSWIPSRQFLDSLPALMELVALPGLAMAVIEDGALVFTHATGVASTATGEPVRDHSSFEAASLSKPVFAYVVMQLAEEKRIDLDVPLVLYRRPDYLADNPDLESITARDALRHSTGLPNWRKKPGEKLAPSFKPGTRFGYSGEAYFWLQLVVEKLTGQGLDDVARSRLFRPAAMHQTTFAWDADQERRSVYGHTGPGDNEGKIPFQLNRELGRILLPIAEKSGKPLSAWTYDDVLKAIPDARTLPATKDWPKDAAAASIDYFKMPMNMIPNAAGSLRTTAADYARFLALMLDGGVRQPWQISEAGRKAMLTARLPVASGKIFSRGLGWALDHHIPGRPVFGHGGNNADVFRSFTVADARARKAIVVFTNGGGGNEIFPRVVRAATGLDVLDMVM